MLYSLAEENWSGKIRIEKKTENELNIVLFENFLTL